MKCCYCISEASQGWIFRHALSGEKRFLCSKCCDRLSTDEKQEFKEKSNAVYMDTDAMPPTGPAEPCADRD